MKKIIAFLLLVCCFTFFVGCSPSNNGDDPSSSTIELSIDNYEYYLYLSKTTTNQQMVNLSWLYSYKLTVHGALDAIYEDCTIYYTLDGNTIKTLKLNVAGCAELSYSEYKDTKFVITNVTGKIIR